MGFIWIRYLATFSEPIYRQFGFIFNVSRNLPLFLDATEIVLSSAKL